MKKIFAVVLFAALALALCACQKDDPYEKETFSGNDIITVIDVTERHSEVELRPSDDESWKVEYYTNKYDEYSVSLKDGVLKLECSCSHNSGFIDNLKEGRLSAVSIEKKGLPTIIYVPRSFGGDLKLYNNAGGITVNGLNLNSAEISDNAGSVILKNATANEINILTDAGNVEADGNFSNIKIATGVGNVRVAGQASAADITTELGNVKLNALAVNSLNITTELGNIEGSLAGSASDYKITLDGGIGKSNISNTDVGEKTLTIKRTMGSINITFAD